MSKKKKRRRSEAFGHVLHGFMYGNFIGGLIILFFAITYVNGPLLVLGSLAVVTSVGSLRWQR